MPVTIGTRQATRAVVDGTKKENEAAENDAEHNARRRRADFGERNECNSAVKPRLHHGCREEERRADKAEGW